MLFNIAINKEAKIIAKKVAVLPQLSDAGLITSTYKGQILLLSENTMELSKSISVKHNIEAIEIGVLEDSFLVYKSYDELQEYDFNLTLKNTWKKKNFDFSLISNYFDRELIITETIPLNDHDMIIQLYDYRNDKIVWEKSDLKNSLFYLRKGNKIIKTGGRNNGDLICLDFNTGETIWKNTIAKIGNHPDPFGIRKTIEGYIKDSAFIYENIVVVAVFGFHIIAFDINTGGKIWTIKLDFDNVRLSPSLPEKIFYTIGSNDLYKIDIITGEIISQKPIWNEFKTYGLISPGGSVLTVTDNYLYGIFYRNQVGLLFAINRETAKIDFSYDFNELIPYNNFPLIINNRMYCLSYEGNLFVFESEL